MQMLMIQLACAVAVLFSSVSLHPLPTIIDTINSYNITLNQQMYVERLERQDNGNKCSNAFFCKAHDILVQHKNASGNEQDAILIRNLKQIIQKYNCGETLKTMKSMTEKIRFIDFLDSFKECIQCRNMKPNEKSC